MINQPTDGKQVYVIPMSELVKDPIYRKFLETKPKTPAISRSEKMNISPPWVVYIQLKPDQRWKKKEFWKYSEAFHFMRRWLKQGAHDAALNNKRIPFDPPSRMARIKGKFVKGSDGVVRQATTIVHWKLPSALQVDQPEHHWCRYCRRPTVFKFYSKHPRLGSVDSFVPRCCICGASTRIALPASDRMFRIH